MNLSELRRFMIAPPDQFQGLNPLGEFSPLALMREKQSAEQDPRRRVMSREIDPGVTWGGRDNNTATPNDLMRSYFEPQLLGKRL